MIATASREDSARWCRDRGADVVVNYRDLKGELAKHGLTFVDYIFILNDTDGHWDAVSDLIARAGWDRWRSVCEAQQQGKGDRNGVP